MAEQANTAATQRFYEAMDRGDIPALLELVADDVDWTFQGPSRLPFAGTYRGHEGVGDFLGAVASTIEFERFTPREFVAQGETVVVLGDERSRIPATDHVVEQAWAHVYRFRDGQIAAFQAFEDTAALVAALEGG